MDAEIAYVPVASSYGTQSYFYSGDITDEKIDLVTTENCFEINPEENAMDYVVVEMTGQELIDQALDSADGGMAAFAGVEMIYSLSGENGKQYVSLKIEGEDMDKNKIYRVASLRGAVSGAKVVASYNGLTFREIFKNYLEAQRGIVEAPKQLVFIN